MLSVFYARKVWARSTESGKKYRSYVCGSNERVSLYGLLYSKTYRRKRIRSAFGNGIRSAFWNVSVALRATKKQDPTCHLKWLRNLLRLCFSPIRIGL